MIWYDLQMFSLNNTVPCARAWVAPVFQMVADESVDADAGVDADVGVHVAIHGPFLC